MMSSMPPNSYHPDHPSVFQSSGSHTRQHSGLVPAPPGSYSSSYNYPPPHSASYLSSPSLDGAQDSKDNLNLLGQSSSSHSSDTSQPASPNYPPGMNPNEHRKSFESAADIKHRRRTTKSQFQTLETTFQSEFLLKDWRGGGGGVDKEKKKEDWEFWVCACSVNHVLSFSHRAFFFSAISSFFSR